MRINFSIPLSIADLATIFAALFVVVQLMIQTSAARAQARAYLHLSVNMRIQSGREMVYFHIYNSGKTPAKNISIEFIPNSGWKALKHNAKLGFEYNSIALSVRPLEEVVYLLGPLKDLPVYLDSSVKAVVQYKAINFSRPKRETTNLSLLTNRYQSNSRYRTVD